MFCEQWGMFMRAEAPPGCGYTVRSGLCPEGLRPLIGIFEEAKAASHDLDFLRMHRADSPVGFRGSGWAGDLAVAADRRQSGGQHPRRRRATPAASLPIRRFVGAACVTGMRESMREVFGDGDRFLRKQGYPHPTSP